jgi:hypothetical protein
MLISTRPPAASALDENGNGCPGDAERPAPQREPAELSWREAKAIVAVGVHHRRRGVAALGLHRRDAIWAAQHEQRLEHAHIKQQQHPEHHQADPQRALARVFQIEAPAHHVHDAAAHGHQRQHDLAGMPELVADLQPHPPQRHHHQQRQRADRGHRGHGAQRHRAVFVPCQQLGSRGYVIAHAGVDVPFLATCV